MCQAVKWDQQVTSAGPPSAIEHKKISDIKYLNPFKTKTTPGKIAGMTSPEPTNAPTTLAKSSETPHSDDTGMLKIACCELNVGASDASTTKTQNTAKKRSRSSPSKKTAKKLFKDQDDAGNGDDDTCADGAGEPSSQEDV